MVGGTPTTETKRTRFICVNDCSGVLFFAKTPLGGWGLKNKKKILACWQTGSGKRVTLPTGRQETP
ncbi:MAG: hypothetical protein EAZ51_03995 [Sphingobacteriales bacterium]|nr:MAG: hypothetical protein EAZ64_03770 [Sphingobacteriales bacterium]TAF81541.1 MAG: hypothetical protein EAZ51_03995 [Sphingobacteriales bacterium]